MKQIEQVLTLLDKRDNEYLERNKQVAELIAPTMLTAIVDCLGVDPDNISWVDIKVYDVYLVLTCSVRFDPNAPNLSVFLRDSNYTPGSPSVEVERPLRIGVPLAKVFDTAEEIKAFLMKPFVPTDAVEQAGSDTSVKVEEVKKPTIDDQFDAKTLTREQLNQMLYFQHMSVGIKQ